MPPNTPKYTPLSSLPRSGVLQCQQHDQAAAGQGQDLLAGFYGYPAAE